MSIPARLLLFAIMALAPAETLLASAPDSISTATKSSATPIDIPNPALHTPHSTPVFHTPHSTLFPADTLDADTNNLPVDATISGYVVPLLTLLISVPIHELGHFVVAKSVGAGLVEIHFFPGSSGGLPTIAATEVDTKGLSKLDIGLIAIAGVGTTRLMAEVCDRFARGFDSRMTYPTFAQIMTSALFIYGRLDFPGYLLSDLVTNLSQRPGGDIDILVTQIAGRATLPRVGAYLGLLVIAGIDVYLDLDRIEYHYTIFNGKQRAHPSTASRLRVGMVPGGIGMGWSVTF